MLVCSCPRQCPLDDTPKVAGPQMPQGQKLDRGKAPWSLLPWTAVSEVVEVLRYGAEKYAPDNWQHVDRARDRYFDALMRHLLEWRKGPLRKFNPEDVPRSIDRESGLPHLAHAACCVLFLLWFDARPRPGEATGKEAT